MSRKRPGTRGASGRPQPPPPAPAPSPSAATGLDAPTQPPDGEPQGTLDPTHRGPLPEERSAIPIPGAQAISLLLCEPGKPNQKRAEELARGFGYRLLLAETVADALKLVRADTPPELVLAGLPDGEPVLHAVRELAGDRPSTIVALSGESHEGHEACERTGADTFVLRPYRRDALGAVLRAATALRGERRRAVRLESDLARERARLLRYGESDPRTGFPHFEFFKKLLELELKRSRRYGYSLAVCLVCVDEPPLEALSRVARGNVYVAVARRLRGVIRDIDLPVDYADGHFLVFLPYTDLAGARRVGQRVVEIVASAPFEDGPRRLVATCSVGLSALKPGRQVSFARLIRDANMALRAAQLKGGGRLVAKG